jgi:hypothetical protein
VGWGSGALRQPLRGVVRYIKEGAMCNWACALPGRCVWLSRALVACYLSGKLTYML